MIEITLDEAKKVGKNFFNDIHGGAFCIVGNVIVIISAARPEPEEPGAGGHEESLDAGNNSV